MTRWMAVVGVAGALALAAGCGQFGQTVAQGGSTTTTFAIPTTTYETTTTEPDTTTTEETTTTTTPPTTVAPPPTTAPSAAAVAACASAISSAVSASGGGTTNPTTNPFGPTTIAACPSIGVFNAAITSLQPAGTSPSESQGKIEALDFLLQAVCSADATARTSSLCTSLAANPPSATTP